METAKILKGKYMFQYISIFFCTVHALCTISPQNNQACSWKKNLTYIVHLKCYMPTVEEVQTITF